MIVGFNSVKNASTLLQKEQKKDLSFGHTSIMKEGIKTVDEKLGEISESFIRNGVNHNDAKKFINELVNKGLRAKNYQKQMNSSFLEGKELESYYKKPKGPIRKFFQNIYKTVTGKNKPEQLPNYNKIKVLKEEINQNPEHVQQLRYFEENKNILLKEKLDNQEKTINGLQKKLDGTTKVYEQVDLTEQIRKAKAPINANANAKVNADNENLYKFDNFYKEDVNLYEESDRNYHNELKKNPKPFKIYNNLRMIKLLEQKPNNSYDEVVNVIHNKVMNNGIGSFKKVANSKEKIVTSNRNLQENVTNNTGFVGKRINKTGFSEQVNTSNRNLQENVTNNSGFVDKTTNNKIGSPNNVVNSKINVVNTTQETAKADKKLIDGLFSNSNETRVRNEEEFNKRMKNNGFKDTNPQVNKAGASFGDENTLELSEKDIKEIKRKNSEKDNVELPDYKPVTIYSKLKGIISKNDDIVSKNDDIISKNKGIINKEMKEMPPASEYYINTSSHNNKYNSQMNNSTDIDAMPIQEQVKKYNEIVNNSANNIKEGDGVPFYMSKTQRENSHLFRPISNVKSPFKDNADFKYTVDLFGLGNKRVDPQRVEAFVIKEVDKIAKSEGRSTEMAIKAYKTRISVAEEKKPGYIDKLVEENKLYKPKENPYNNKNRKREVGHGRNGSMQTQELA